MHKKIAIIYEGGGADPAHDRIRHTSGDVILHIVAVGNSEQVVPLVQELVGAGVTLVQLCGGMPAHVRAAVESSVGGAVEISAVLFGIESIVPAARYSQAFEAGAPPPEAFLIVLPGWSETTRSHKAFAPQDTTFVIVADEASASGVAGELVAASVGLIELYGMWSPGGEASVIEAANGRAAVGVTSYRAR